MEVLSGQVRGETKVEVRVKVSLIIVRFLSTLICNAMQFLQHLPNREIIT